MAGHKLLETMARDLRDERLQPDDGRALAERFMAILRDERSGICFRDLHGFNSTGSQVSLLPRFDVAGAAHLFTCASDPKEAAYKRFDFAYPGGTGEEGG